MFKSLARLKPRAMAKRDELIGLIDFDDVICPP
jgi:hypothetical protein